MRVPPYFTSDMRFLIIQVGDFTYIIDVPNWNIHLRIEGFPIGVSKDESLLLVGHVDSLKQTRTFICQFKTSKELLLKEVEAEAFDLHQRLCFLHNRFTHIIFYDSFVPEYTQKFELGSACITSYRPIFKTLASPIVAINGRCESDWGGFDFAWIGNLDTSEMIYTHSLMENAPMTINYTLLSKKLMLVAGDGVNIVDVTQKTRQSQAQRVFAAKPFNANSIWEGNAEKVDAVAHPSDSNLVIVAWRKNWYEVYLSADEVEVRIKDKAKTLDTEIIRMAYHPNGQMLAVLTKQDIRLYEIATGKLLEVTPIS